jgi:hypothetical protein
LDETFAPIGGHVLIRDRRIITMTKRKIEIFESDSVENAQALAREKAPEGSHLIEEQVLAKGGLQRVEGFGDSPERAVDDAKGRLPPNAEIFGTKLISPPGKRTVSVDAFNEEQARSQVLASVETLESIATVVRTSPGKKGFLGIGKSPGRYDVNIMKKAVANVDYTVKARISVEFYDGTSSLCEDESPASWAEKLHIRKEYRALAAIYNCKDSNVSSSKKYEARSILIQSGAESVSSILDELASGGVGESDLVEMLVRIGDPRAVPVLKRLLDRGRFDAGRSSIDSIRQFVERHPEFHGETEKVTCAVCGRVRPVAETRGYYDGPQESRFCRTTCWSNRGRVLKSGIGTDCPYYKNGICVPEGQDTGLCSLGVGSYLTSCYVYSMHRR